MQWLRRHTGGTSITTWCSDWGAIRAIGITTWLLVVWKTSKFRLHSNHRLHLWQTAGENGNDLCTSTTYLVFRAFCTVTCYMKEQYGDTDKPIRSVPDEWHFKFRAQIWKIIMRENTVFMLLHSATHANIHIHSAAKRLLTAFQNNGSTRHFCKRSNQHKHLNLQLTSTALFCNVHASNNRNIQIVESN